MRKTTLLGLMFLAAAAAGPGSTPAAEVKLASCPAATDGARVCVPVKLASDGARVASAGVTITYDTTALRLPGGSADVKAGAALSNGQRLAAHVLEDANAGAGKVQITITPPVQLPIAVIGDGTIAEVCFTGPADGAGNCAAARVASSELGDDFGRQIR